MGDRPMPSSFDENDDFRNESGFRKIVAKIKREPLIPLGGALTVAALVGAFRANRRGDHNQVQRMFRARVLAQGFTVVAMVVGGIYFNAERHKERELWKIQRASDEEEKRQRWIKELEIRDEEDKALKEVMDKRKRRAAERVENAKEKVEGGVLAAVDKMEKEAGKAKKEVEGAAEKAEEKAKSWGWFGGGKPPSQGATDAKETGADPGKR